MNNLHYFRTESGIDVKLLAKLLNVTVHTYLAFEQEKMHLPYEIKIMLSMIYEVDENDFFCESSDLTNDTKQKVQKLSQLKDENLIKVLKERLFENPNVDINYRTVNKVKKEILKNNCE